MNFKNAGPPGTTLAARLPPPRRPCGAVAPNEGGPAKSAWRMFLAPRARNVGGPRHADFSLKLAAPSSRLRGEGSARPRGGQAAFKIVDQVVAIL